ncbi:serine/threonine protein kinase [Dictyobacter aurantiacus]|uniref:Protein kinase domain-containing protein n=1 Tax=Dictyobacter aurantiacus TaxID=1936993 RepID=A0A401ZPD9_9CHLR|nr:serine/threonine-protein kinase [Dictyobacter aurantiacus]GCE08723.1 hypothetical protein KDAU_60520 [Dictyobacter aurantiacus]
MALEGIYLGRYRLQQQLGSGGMGEVYLADDTRIKRRVAVKVVRNDSPMYRASENVQKSTQLFEREMHAIASLDHPAILPLFDYGEQDVNGATLTYMVMPYRPEGSLYQWVRDRDEHDLLPSLEVARLISQAAGALQHAHSQGIVHQDVKPDNFLLRIRPEQPSQPDLLLADFGVARSLLVTSHTSQTIRGTLTYMAPEQWDGHPVFATDQYALAIMAYELLVGQPPFDGAPGQIMYKHMHVPPEPPSRLNPALPPGVDAVLLRALAKQPEDRFPSVFDFAQALQKSLQASASGRLPWLMPNKGSDEDNAAPVRLALMEHSTPTIAISGGGAAQRQDAVTPVPYRRFQPAQDFSTRKMTLIFLAALVLLVGGAGWAYAFTLSHPLGKLDLFAAPDHAATQTAVARSLHNISATQTAVTQRDVTGTAQAQTHLNATATAVTQQHIAATATAVAVSQLLQADKTSFQNLDGCSTMGFGLANCPITLTNRSNNDVHWVATSNLPNYLGSINSEDGDNNQGTVGAQNSQMVNATVALRCGFGNGGQTSKSARFTIQGPHNAIDITITWQCQ